VVCHVRRRVRVWCGAERRKYFVRVYHFSWCLSFSAHFYVGIQYSDADGCCSIARVRALGR